MIIENIVHEHKILEKKLNDKLEIIESRKTRKILQNTYLPKNKTRNCITIHRVWRLLETRNNVSQNIVPDNRVSNRSIL